MSEPGQPARRRTLRVLVREAHPCWLQLAGLLGLNLLTAPLTLLSPLPLKWTVDCVLGNQPLPGPLAALLPAGTLRTSGMMVGSLAGLVVALALARLLADFAFSVLRTYAGERLVLNFRAKLFRHTQRLSLSYHDTRGTTDSAYRIQYDAPAIQWITIDAAIPLITAGVTVASMIVVLGQMDWLLAVVGLTVTPALFFVSQSFNRRLKLRWREAKDVESATLGVVQEVLSAVRVVKAFAQEDREQRRYLDHAGRGLGEQLRLAVTGGGLSMIVGMIMALGTATVLFLGARRVQAGGLTLGEFILVMSYLALLYGPLQTLSRSAASLQGSFVSFERALALLDEAPDVPEHPHPRPLARAQGHVVFQEVSFAYGQGRPALKDVSLEIPAGSRVGIAGATGAGKSTLVSLLLRLYDPSQGRILLDGVDLKEYRLSDLRNQFAIVLQEPVLFSTSIAENIAYARPAATEAEILAAARAANAHQFIKRLPQGYRTEVGERGVQLSGGERQRLSLARAFLKDAPILILDEPTSSVDVGTEATILEAMERLMERRTTLMIAHRLGTLEICNLRLELEDGKLISLRSSNTDPRPTRATVP